MTPSMRPPFVGPLLDPSVSLLLWDLTAGPPCGAPVDLPMGKPFEGPPLLDPLLETT